MIDCVTCCAALLERTVSGHKVLLCPGCGNIFVQIPGSENRYRYAGTTHGNQYLRELLAFIDRKEEQDNATMAFETNTSPGRETPV